MTDRPLDPPKVILDEALARLRESRAGARWVLMQNCKPEGMVSRPHFCLWSDRLSVALRDLEAALDALAQAEREHRELVEDYQRAQHGWAAVRQERDTLREALAEAVVILAVADAQGCFNVAWQERVARVREIEDG